MGIGNSKSQKYHQSKIVQNNSKESSFPDIHKDPHVQLHAIPNDSEILHSKSKSSPRISEDPIPVTLAASPISRPQQSRYPSYACKRVNNVLDFRTIQPMRPNSVSKLYKASNYIPPLERRWTGLTNSRPPPRTWMDELKKGIDELAVTRAPTTIDPPDLSFRASNEEIINSPLGKNDHLMATEKSEIDEALDNSAVNFYNRVKTIDSPSNPSSDSDYPEIVPDIKKSKYDEDDTITGDSDCSTSPKFWAKHPRARSSGSRIASFMIAPFEDAPSIRTNTVVINRNAKKPVASVRNSISAQNWKSPRARVNPNRNKTSMSCDSFYGQNQGISKVTNSDQYKQPPSEPLKYSSESEETDATELSDQDQPIPQSEVSDQSRASTAQADMDVAKYFTYRKKPILSKQSTSSSSSCSRNTLMPQNGRSPKMDRSGLENPTMNPKLEYDSTQFESSDTSEEERVRSANVQTVEEDSDFDKWSSCSDYGIDQITPPSELLKIGTYSEDEFSKYSSSDEGKLKEVVQKANLDTPKLETLTEKDERETESGGAGGTAVEPRQRKRKSRGLICRKFFRFFTKQTGN